MAETARRNEEIYTWQQFDEDIEKIANWAKDKKFKSVYGIPTGGLTPAVKLHNLLEVPLVRHEGDITKDTLIIDDIVTTGKTIKRLLNIIGSGFRVATLCCNVDADRPDFFVRPTTKWVRFPWETEKTSRYDRMSF